MPRRDLLAGYYLATPVFLVLDFWVGVPLRVAGLDEPWQRALYYAGAFGCGIACRLRPKATPWIGMFESAANVFLLILAIMLPVYGLMDAVLVGEELVGPFDGISLGNVILSGSVFTASFYRHQAAALTGKGTPFKRV